jgi:hypothetical protein
MCNQQDQKFKKQWAELEVLRVPLEPPEFRCASRVRGFAGELFVEGHDLACSRAIDLGNYLIAYLMDVRIINRLSGTVHILDSWLQLPWADSRFHWLPDPAEHVPPEEVYKFPSDSPLWYPRAMVLNHRLQQPLRRGGVREGLLLGLGSAPIPQDIRNGTEIEATLILVDQWDCSHSAKLELLVDRTASERKRVRPKRERLFAHRLAEPEKRDSGVAPGYRPASEAEPRKDAAVPKVEEPSADTRSPELQEVGVEFQTPGR